MVKIVNILLNKQYPVSNSKQQVSVFFVVWKATTDCQNHDIYNLKEPWPFKYHFPYKSDLGGRQM